MLKGAIQEKMSEIFIGAGRGCGGGISVINIFFVFKTIFRLKRDAD